MKKGESVKSDDLRPEYRREDLGKGVRGKFFQFMLTDHCIYTIKHSDELEHVYEQGGTGKWSEQKKWVKAKQLLDEAKHTGKRLPIIFAPAEATRRLIAWALLDDIDSGPPAIYTFSHLRFFEKRPLKTTLKKVKDGESLDEWFVRPYAICHTPRYLITAAVTDDWLPATEEFDIEGIKTETRRITSKRSRRLRGLAFQAARGICCVCGRDFSKVLSGRGIRVLQVHHRKQLSALKTPAVTRVEDLAVVCANCHMLLHLDPKRAMDVAELKEMLHKDQSDESV